MVSQKGYILSEQDASVLKRAFSKIKTNTKTDSSTSIKHNINSGGYRTVGQLAQGVNSLTAYQIFNVGTIADDGSFVMSNEQVQAMVVNLNGDVFSPDQLDYDGYYYIVQITTGGLIAYTAGLGGDGGTPVVAKIPVKYPIFPMYYKDGSVNPYKTTTEGSDTLEYSETAGGTYDPNKQYLISTFFNAVRMGLVEDVANPEPIQATYKGGEVYWVNPINSNEVDEDDDLGEWDSTNIGLAPEGTAEGDPIEPEKKRRMKVELQYADKEHTIPLYLRKIEPYKTMNNYQAMQLQGTYFYTPLFKYVYSDNEKSNGAIIINNNPVFNGIPYVLFNDLFQSRMEPTQEYENDPGNPDNWIGVGGSIGENGIDGQAIWETTQDESVAMRQYTPALCRNSDVCEALINGDMVAFSPASIIIKRQQTDAYGVRVYESEGSGSGSGSGRNAVIEEKVFNYIEVTAPEGYEYPLQGRADTNYCLFDKIDYGLSPSESIVDDINDRLLYLSVNALPQDPENEGFVEEDDLLPTQIAEPVVILDVAGSGDFQGKAKIDNVFSLCNDCSTPYLIGIFDRRDVEGIKYPTGVRCPYLPFSWAVECMVASCYYRTAEDKCSPKWNKPIHVIERNGTKLVLAMTTCAKPCVDTTQVIQEANPVQTTTT